MKKTILVGVTSSVATYKSVQLVSDLLKLGYDVEVIMSENATKFVQPLTFSSLTKHKTYVETFDREVDYSIEHISLAKKADAFIIAPATANVIAKIAHGICDDMLTTTFLACTCPKIIAPAMNTNMYNNPITKDNLKRCKFYGMQIVEPAYGLLACGDEGKGKLADVSTLIDTIQMAVFPSKPLLGKKVLVSAGPTQENLDPVRFISNHSSGKMGYAIARAARNMGAEVTLVSGPVGLEPIPFIDIIYTVSAEDMANAMKSKYNDADYIVMAAAVGDATPIYKEDNKIKKEAMKNTIEITSTEDILAYLGNHKTHQKICGFAMETEDVIKNAKKKFKKKNCDVLVVNDLTVAGAGFQSDTNQVSIITKDSEVNIDMMSKDELAYLILDTLQKS